MLSVETDVVMIQSRRTPWNVVESLVVYPPGDIDPASIRPLNCGSIAPSAHHTTPSF
jgi:hypothetical protein